MESAAESGARALAGNARVVVPDFGFPNLENGKAKFEKKFALLSGTLTSPRSTGRLAATYEQRIHELQCPLASVSGFRGSGQGWSARDYPARVRSEHGGRISFLSLPGSGDTTVSEPARNRRPPMAVAMQWVSQITTVSLMMVLPALGGLWLDRTFGTGPWLLIVGALLGLLASMMHLLRMVGAIQSSQRSRKE